MSRTQAGVTTEARWLYRGRLCHICLDRNQAAALEGLSFGKHFHSRSTDLTLPTGAGCLPGRCKMNKWQTCPQSPPPNRRRLQGVTGETDTQNVNYAVLRLGPSPPSLLIQYRTRDSPDTASQRRQWCPRPRTNSAAARPGYFPFMLWLLLCGVFFFFFFFWFTRCLGS